MSTSTRRPVKFTNAAGNNAYTFPRYNLDYDATQPLEQPSVQLTGASYDYDLMGELPAIRRNGAHTLRFILLGTPEAMETELDTMRAAVYENARGWLYLEDSQGVQRRCVARVTEMPQVHLGFRDRASTPVVISFIQYSDFYDIENIDEHDGAIQVVAGDPDHLFVNNPGNANVYNAIITIKGPYDNVRIENHSSQLPNAPTINYIIEISVTGATMADWLRIDCGSRAVQVSDDSGATWTNIDVDDFIIEEGQVSMMVYVPGLNDLEISGCDTCEVVHEFAGAWV